MKNLMEMRKALNAKRQDAIGLIEKAQGEKRSLTDDENSQLQSLQQEIENMGNEIRLEETRQQLAMQNAQDATQDDANQKGQKFEGMQDFIRSIIFNPADPRLVEARDLNMSEGAKGGFLVPKQYRDEIFQVQPQDAIVRPRAMIVPAGERPDAGISVPALDQSGAKGVYSGVVVDWIEEGGDKPETEPTFREIELNPKEVAAHTVLTDKLMRNSTAAATLVQNLLRRAILAAEDHAFISGNGVGKPLGILGHPSNIAVNRAVANQISYADVVGMYSKMMMGRRMVFVASQSILPQLMTMTDAGGRLIWQPNARDGAPGTLLGIPVLLNERNPVLGAKGDLMLIDFDMYMIKDGTPLSISASEHVFFRKNKTVIKAFWNVDGQPWLTSPLTQENGIYKVSPFVVLDVPAVG